MSDKGCVCTGKAFAPERSQLYMPHRHGIHQVTPFLHVPDLEAALDLLTRVLRFEVLYTEANYRYLRWGPAGLRVLEERGRPAPDEARMTVYVDVDDVDALHEALLPGLSALPDGDVEGPVDQSWNQRELLVRLPDGNWIAFGQAVATPEAPAE